ncbi:MAG: Apocarotenoid-15,15'-oxygenase [Acaryochloridaceae cyanobacterium SU_2_1]|nr:Apocarotenoid-15,15'-oxygenase [Acaryochloridaceae cyanobacterium SU_2_1]
MENLTLSTSVPRPSTAYLDHNWAGGHQSLTEEYDYWIDEIEGEIPQELKGTVFRNGPGLLDVGGTPLYHPFDGDGMICALTFDQGKAHFRNRFVKTAGYLAEQAAGKNSVSGGCLGLLSRGGWLANAFDINFKNIANTHVIYWAGKLLALWEADQPYRLDPATLETLGLEDFSGLLKPGDPFSAHPRILKGATAAEDRLVTFSVKPGLSSVVKVYEFDTQANLVHQDQFSMPGFAFIHDFAVTPHYYIFFQNPVTLNPLPFVLGFKGAGECITFKKGQPTQIWLLPRNGSGHLIKAATEACFVFHHANAYEQDDQVIIDSICYDSFPKLDPQVDFRDINFDTVPPAQLWRFRLSLTSFQVERQPLVTRSCEFPALDPRQVSQPYRFVYLGAADAATGNAPLQALLKVDLQTGAEELWSAAPQGFMGEPVFIPHPAVAEQGWLVALVYDGDRNRSDVVILATENIKQGPIARLALKHHVPYGLHGSFTPTLF